LNSSAILSSDFVRDIHAVRHPAAHQRPDRDDGPHLQQDRRDSMGVAEAVGEDRAGRFTKRPVLFPTDLAETERLALKTSKH